MKIGVISDTHGVIERTRLAVELFEREAVEAIVHCGDVGGLDVLQLFASRPFWFVWGNTDHPDASWRGAMEAWGMAWPEKGPLRLEVGQRRIVVAHGHEREFRHVLHDPQADYLFYGHSHVRVVIRGVGCTIVNPGAIQRTSLATVAIVDLDTDEVRHVDLHGQVVPAD